MALVLIVDDSMYQRIRLRKILEAAGYQVLEGVDGEQVIDLVENNRPDCLLLDLLMPKVDGVEALKSIQEKHPKIPVIILTSDIQEQTRQECLSLGAFAFLNKPAKEPDLLATIEQAIQSQKKEI